MTGQTLTPEQYGLGARLRILFQGDVSRRSCGGVPEGSSGASELKTWDLVKQGPCE